MKIAVGVFVFLISQLSQASYYQVDCSNATATTTYSHGHTRNALILQLEAIHTEEPESAEFDVNLIKIDVLESQDLRKVETTTCVEGRSGGGGMSSTTWYYQKVKITKVDGSEFQEEPIYDAGSDAKSIETDWICKREISSRTWCP